MFFFLFTNLQNHISIFKRDDYKIETENLILLILFSNECTKFELWQLKIIQFNWTHIFRRMIFFTISKITFEIPDPNFTYFENILLSTTEHIFAIK